MKTMFIPKGTTVRHESVSTDELIVKGELIVEGTIQAKRITGKGVIKAKKINAHTVIADVLDVDNIYVKKVIANKIFCISIKASHGVVATDYIEAYSVKTPRLAATLSQIDKTDASEIISLSPKKRSFIGVLFMAWVKGLFVVWQHERAIKKTANSLDSDKKETAASDIDKETEKILESYRAMCDKGYRLVLEPVVPDKTEKIA